MKVFFLEMDEPENRLSELVTAAAAVVSQVDGSDNPAAGVGMEAPVKMEAQKKRKCPDGAVEDDSNVIAEANELESILDDEFYVWSDSEGVTCQAICAGNIMLKDFVRQSCSCPEHTYACRRKFYRTRGRSALITYERNDLNQAFRDRANVKMAPSWQDRRTIF